MLSKISPSIYVGEKGKSCNLFFEENEITVIAYDENHAIGSRKFTIEQFVEKMTQIVSSPAILSAYPDKIRIVDHQDNAELDRKRFPPDEFYS